MYGNLEFNPEVCYYNGGVTISTTYPCLLYGFMSCHLFLCQHAMLCLDAETSQKSTDFILPLRISVSEHVLARLTHVNACFFKVAARSR